MPRLCFPRPDPFPDYGLKSLPIVFNHNYPTRTYDHATFFNIFDYPFRCTYLYFKKISPFAIFRTS